MTTTKPSLKKCHVCGVSERGENLILCHKCGRPACMNDRGSEIEYSDEHSPKEVKRCNPCRGIRR